MLLNKRFTFALGVIISLMCNTTYAACTNNIIDEWPNSRYTDHNDGTVTDTITGLMWQQCSEGQTFAINACTGTASTHTWKAALELASNKTFAGHSDWRLPNFKELRSLVARNCYNPVINQTLFPGTPANEFWSTSPDANNSSNAWGISFENGVSSNSISRGSSNRARLVRGG